MTFLENSGFQSGGHSCAQIVAFLDKARVKLAAADQRLLNRAPSQACGDGLYRPAGSSAVMARTDEKGIWQALGLLQAGIEDSVEKIFQCPAHIAQVFGCSEDDGIRVNNLLWSGVKRRHADYFHDLGSDAFGTGSDGFPQCSCVVRRAMRDDKKGLVHSVSLANRIVPCGHILANVEPLEFRCPALNLSGLLAAWRLPRRVAANRRRRICATGTGETWPMPDSQHTSTNDVIETLLNRVSVRKYTDQPVTEEMLDTILKTAFRAPTSSNIQTYSVVVVRDQERRDALMAACGNQRHIGTAPVFLAFCADLTRIEDALRRNGHNIDSNNLETGLVSSIDASLVGMAAYLVADSLGLKGVMIGGARNKPVEVARILGLPQRVFCVFGMCLGWPAEAPAQKPRMDYSGVVHFEQFGQNRSGADATAIVDSYDAALADHYRGQGRQTTDASWSDDMDKKFAPPLRDDLRQRLKELGFDFR